MKKIFVVGVALGLLALGGFAEEDEKAKPPKPKPACDDGVKYDDGKLETGIASISNANFVMLIEAPSYPAKLETLCIAWLKESFRRNVSFDVLIWAADGEKGGPGALLYRIPGLWASRITRKGEFYTYDVRAHSIIIDGPVFIGPYWDPPAWDAVYLGEDDGPRTPRRRAFYISGILDDVTVLDEETIRNEFISVYEMDVDNDFGYRALGIRARFGPP
jgi:hypothetical protein